VVIKTGYHHRPHPLPLPNPLIDRCDVPNAMLNANWIVALVGVAMLQILASWFIWRTHLLKTKIRIKMASTASLFLKMCIPISLFYMAIIILVDVGVLPTHPWYPIASASYAVFLTATFFAA